MSAATTSRTGASVDEYLATAEPASRREDAFELKALMDEVSGAPAEMWGPSMVGYGEFGYRYASGHSGNTFVMGFAPRKANMSIYGLLIPENEELLERLGQVKIGKGCIWAGRLDKLERAVLREMIRRAWAQQSWTHPLGHIFDRVR